MEYFKLLKPTGSKGSNRWKGHRMVHTVILYDGKNYQAYVSFTPKQNGRVDCIGWKMMAYTREVLKEMLEDIAAYYPPKRDISVEIRECDKFP
ncbi:MAG: hypothetical protein IJZ44_02145 [Lachnospiraceae bacterium]|nr:hypothetical protein [Lachnospiraceae bacterium]